MPNERNIVSEDDAGFLSTNLNEFLNIGFNYNRPIGEKYFMLYSLTYEYRIITVVNFPVALVLFLIKFHFVLHKKASE